MIAVDASSVLCCHSISVVKKSKGPSSYHGRAYACSLIFFLPFFSFFTSVETMADACAVEIPPLDATVGNLAI
jgi:hypothetical protein